MSTAESLCIEPGLNGKRLRILVQPVVQRRIAAAVASVRVVGRRMFDVEFRNVFTNHQRLARAIRDLSNLDRSPKRLAKEDSTAAGVAMTVAGNRCLPGDWFII